MSLHCAVLQIDRQKMLLACIHNMPSQTRLATNCLASAAAGTPSTSPKVLASFRLRALCSQCRQTAQDHKSSGKKMPSQKPNQAQAALCRASRQEYRSRIALHECRRVSMSRNSFSTHTAGHLQQRPLLAVSAESQGSRRGIALRRLSSLFPFVLTFHSSRPAFSGRLTLGVRFFYIQFINFPGRI